MDTTIYTPFLRQTALQQLVLIHVHCYMEDERVPSEARHTTISFTRPFRAAGDEAQLR